MIFVFLVMQKLPTPQPQTNAKQGQADKAASNALKGKESETSSSSDSEDEKTPTTRNLPPPLSKMLLVSYWCLGPCVFSFSVNFFDSLLEQHTIGAHEKQPGSLREHTQCVLKCERQE